MGALEGIRVIDFGQYIAGPMAAMFLADQGADVIRVEHPNGPLLDSPANATYNRNKRSLVLNLKDPADNDLARQLIESADIVIENFRPGVMDRFGLGPAAMTASNPGLIYCSMPGFAADHPMAALPGWEGTVAAATATYRPNPRTGRPIYTALPFSSSYAAFLAATSIAMALNARARDGLGQVVEVPLYDATFAAIGYRIGGELIAGDAAAMARSLGVTRQFECKDGRWFMYHAGNKNAVDFMQSTGAEWLLPGKIEKLTPDELREKTEALFRTRTAAEWEAFCESVGTEGSICRTSAEWLTNEHALGSEIIVDSQDPVLGTVRGPGLNVRMSETPGELRTARPAPNQHRDEIVASLPAPKRAPATPAQTMRSALEGIKVVDLCIVLAGPTCGRTLAEFGADVVRIDSPHRSTVVFHNDINRGKRSLLLDLKRPEGLDVFWKLVEDADVVVQNFRKGIAEKLGLGYEAVRQRRPDIIYASLNTYGRVGPWANRPGHEQIAQAASGMQVRYGGDGRPVLAPFAVNDYGTGFMGAYGVAMALLERQKTGRGQHVDTALAYTATMLQSLYLHDHAGKTWDEPRGQDAIGDGPLNRAYRCSDGWLFLACRPGELAQLSLAEDEAALEAAFASDTLGAWIAKLHGAGIGAHAIVEDVAALRDDPYVRAHGLALTRDHEGLGPVTTNGPSPRLSRTPAVPGRPAPKPGSDAASILADINMSAELHRLVESGVVVLDGVGVR